MGGIPAINYKDVNYSGKPLKYLQKTYLSGFVSNVIAVKSNVIGTAVGNGVSDGVGNVSSKVITTPWSATSRKQSQPL